MQNYFSLLLILFLMYYAITGCNRKEDKTKTNLDYLKAYEISVKEPSGLDLTITKDGFWTVSDDNSTVYKLDSWGKIANSFKVNGSSLEGITVVDEEKLAVVLERSREVVIVDTSGKELSRRSLNIGGSENNGLEGITYDPEQKKFFVLNEKKPCLLITLDKNLNELSKDTLKFLKDASGIYFDGKNKLLWILSDESKLVAKLNLNGEVLQKYHITFAQPEGITIDVERQRMYLVSDRNNTLYVYELK